MIKHRFCDRVSFRQRGFTLPELILVTAIIALLVASAVIGFQDFARFQQYTQAVGDVVFQLQQTKVAARSAVDDSAHGIKFSGGTLIRFTGDVYNASDPDNITFSYGQVVFTPNLTGGSDEIIFARLTGLPSATGTILVEGISYVASTTLGVTNTGIVQYE